MHMGMRHVRPDDSRMYVRNAQNVSLAQCYHACRTHQCIILHIRKIPHKLYLDFRYNQDVTRLNRVDVHEGKRLAVFVDFMARDFTFNDFREHTVLHTSIVRHEIPRKGTYRLSKSVTLSTMTTMKRILLYFSAVIFQLMLVLFATAAALILPISNPSGLKERLASSSIYEEVAQNVVEQNIAAYATRIQGADMDVVRSAGNEAVTPEMLQSITEQVIDGTYAWLEGETGQPEFSVDLGPIQEAFAAKLAERAKERLDGLPVCTLEQLRSLAGSAINPFTIPCLPSGVNTQAQADLLAAQIRSSAAAETETLITPDSLPRTAEGEPIAMAFNWLPQAYQLLLPLLWLIAILGLTSAVGIVLLSRDKRSGFRRIGKVLVITGLFTGIVLVGYLFIFRQVNGLVGGAGEAQPVALSILRVITQSFTNIMLICSVIYAIVGLVLVILFRKKRGPEEIRRTV